MLVANLALRCAQRFFLLNLGLAVVFCAESRPDPLKSGDFKWNSSPPLISPEQDRADRCISVKDPSVVYHDGRWHVFATIRSEKRTHQIEYLNFKKWEEANKASRHILKVSDGYFCAPEVFYFTPHHKWYLIYQISIPGRKVELQPAFSTSSEIANPDSWTNPVPLFSEHPANINAWIDFWVICDRKQAHLFFTSNNGKFWRSDTELQKFPSGWSKPEVVLDTDIFEASHTYSVKGSDSFLTVIEAQKDGRRYYKAYTAPSLTGKWTPLADSWMKPFAGRENVAFESERWSDSFSHGELLRASTDEKLEIDPVNLVFLYQGVLDRNREGKPYGQIPWQLGLLRLR
jgi:hypothetical protein